MLLDFLDSVHEWASVDLRFLLVFVGLAISRDTELLVRGWWLRWLTELLLVSVVVAMVVTVVTVMVVLMMLMMLLLVVII